MNTKLISALTLATLTTITGCEGVNDGEYLGEALLSLEGTVTNQRSQTPNGAEVVLFWGSSNDDTLYYGETANVQGTFPASFTLDIFTPPPDAYLREIPGTNGNRAAGATISAWATDQVPSGATPPFDVPESGIIPGLLGLDVEHFLLYVEQDIPAGTVENIIFEQSDRFVSNGLSAGFHVLDIVRLGAPGCPDLPEDPVPADCLMPHPNGINAQLTVELVDTLNDLESYVVY